MHDGLSDSDDAQSAKQQPDLDQRQRREREYHEDYAQRNIGKLAEPVVLDVVESGPRRPWNGYWTAYDFLMAEALNGKRVLVPGCGFGEDAIRLAELGAEVHAFDLSPDLVEIARRRAVMMGVAEIHFDVMPTETLSYSDDFFDLIFFNDILHHVDIPRTVAEARRVLKVGGKIIANELYTYSGLQRIRESRIVTDFLYPHMVRYIYGSEKPYITIDEHKINERELAALEAILAPGIRYRYFLLFLGRIVPGHWSSVAKFERAVFAVCGPASRLIAGRVLLVGRVAK